MSCYAAKNVGADVPRADMRAEMKAVAPHGDSFFSVKQRSSDVRTVATLVHAGFDVIDVGVTLEHSGEGGTGSAHAAVTEATEQDADMVADLAGECFARSRFHADWRIGATRANAIKREWARNACRGRAAVVYVAKSNGKIAGFLSVMTPRNEAVIDLIGVTGAHRGHGFGRALSQRFIRDWRGRAQHLRVGTQAANIPALRLYESLGFRVSETAYVLHAHLRDGEAIA